MKYKKIVLLFAVFSLALLGISQNSFAANYTIDPDHSHVGFRIRHLVSRVPGAFQKFEGNFSYDPAKVKESQGKIVIQAESIATNNAKRDEHLRSPDFFDVKKYPTITYESIKIAPKDKTRFKLEGNLTMHGVTKPVTFDVEHLGSSISPMTKKEILGFTATAKINRKDFGITWNKALDSGGLVLGEDVDLEIQIEAYGN